MLESGDGSSAGSAGLQQFYLICASQTNRGLDMVIIGSQLSFYKLSSQNTPKECLNLNPVLYERS